MLQVSILAVDPRFVITKSYSTAAMVTTTFACCAVVTATNAPLIYTVHSQTAKTFLGRGLKVNINTLTRISIRQAFHPGLLSLHLQLRPGDLPLDCHRDPGAGAPLLRDVPAQLRPHLQPAPEHQHRHLQIRLRPPQRRGGVRRAQAGVPELRPLLHLPHPAAAHRARYLLPGQRLQLSQYVCKNFYC